MTTTTRHTLSDLIDLWVRSQASTGLAKSTIRNRELVARAFMANAGNVQVRQVGRRHVDDYFHTRASGPRPLKASSLNTHKEALDAFFAWAVENKYQAPDANPMKGRRKFRVVPRERLLIPASEFPHLLDCAPHPRDRVIVAMGLYLFSRQSEIKTVRVRDVDLERGYIHIQNHKSATVDDMPICVELDDEIRRWLRFYSEQVSLHHDHYFIPAKPTIFMKGTPTPQDRRGVQLSASLVPTKPMGELHDAAQRTLEAAGHDLTDEDGRSLYEGVHTLRRSGARALYDRLLDDGHDGAIRTVQSMLHHASVQTTEHYLGMKLDKARRDKLLKGQRMFGQPAENVIKLVKEG